MLFAGCKKPFHIRQDDTGYKQEIEEWHQNRLKRLKAKNGWLNLAGLFWLKEGMNTIGSDSANTIVFPPKAPLSICNIELDSNRVYLRSTHVPVYCDSILINTMLLSDDQGGNPTIMTTGSFAWHIIKRGNRYAIRLRDYESPLSDSLKSLDYFHTSTDWVVLAKYRPFKAPKKLMVPTAIGTEEENMVPGELIFRINGRKMTLMPFASSNGFFIVFGDHTSGVETYPSGRFLYTEDPDKNNHVIIDFNKAYNPPCAFTPYATCPLPPRRNLLSVRIEAGEKYVSFRGFPH
jgi:uncharacterized protein (DUF1684 family)